MDVNESALQIMGRDTAEYDVQITTRCLNRHLILAEGGQVGEKLLNENLVCDLVCDVAGLAKVASDTFDLEETNNGEEIRSVEKHLEFVAVDKATFGGHAVLTPVCI